MPATEFAELYEIVQTMPVGPARDDLRTALNTLALCVSLGSTTDITPLLNYMDMDDDGSEMSPEQAAAAFRMSWGG